MGNSATAWFGSSITTAYIFTVLVCDLLGSGFMHVEAKPLHAGKSIVYCHVASNTTTFRVQ